MELCRAAVAAGTRTIVATPHVSWEWPGVTVQVIAEGTARVNDALLAEGIDLEVRTGAEIAMTRAADLSDEELVALRLGGGAGGTYLLIECPYTAARSRSRSWTARRSLLPRRLLSPRASGGCSGCSGELDDRDHDPRQHEGDDRGLRPDPERRHAGHDNRRALCEDRRAMDAAPT